MKKLYAMLMLAGLACSALQGCVDDNQYVVLRGITADGACDATSDDQTYVTNASCNNDGGTAHVSAQVMNYITGETPWSGSGSGSGTTFETTIPNPGMIFVDKIILSCTSVDGESDACDGAENIEISSNVPISGSTGGACIPLAIDLSKLGEWTSSGALVVDIYAKYHDSSLIKGETSHSQVTFSFDASAKSCSQTLAASSEDEE